MKTRNVAVAILTVVALSLIATRTPAGEKKDPPMQVVQAKDLVTKHLEKINGLKSNPKVAWVEEAALKEAFPGLTFIAVQYRQYPLAFAAPEGLSSSNVFAVDKEGKFQTLTSPESLEKFFQTQYKGSKAKITKENLAGANHWAKAWLGLWQELVQDGFYGFEAAQVTSALIDNANLVRAKGAALVTKGGKGELQVTLEFDLEGALKITPVSKLMPGPRPICQATKLLDLDPIVRHMAQSELLFMGLAARPYLLEQRARASHPQLAAAIDRILNRIEAAGW